MQPLVSILVPIYNHAQYISECLDSLKALRYEQIEIVMCNDGSTDDSFKVAADWIAANPSVKATLLNQENQGVCKTVNRLIKASSGRYIALCASDDVLEPDSLTTRVELLEAASDKLACIGDANVINGDSKITAISAMQSLYGANYERLQKNIVDELVFSWSVVGPTLLIKREAYTKLGLYDETLLVEDREFYLRLLAEDALVFIPEVVAKYRVHQSNSSRKNIASRLVVLKQVALSNVMNSKRFSGAHGLFLTSHKIDLALLGCLSGRVAYFVLQAFRVLRKLVVNVFVFLKRNR